LHIVLILLSLSLGLSSLSPLFLPSPAFALRDFFSVFNSLSFPGFEGFMEAHQVDEMEHSGKNGNEFSKSHSSLPFAVMASTVFLTFPFEFIVSWAFFIEITVSIFSVLWTIEFLLMVVFEILESSWNLRFFFFNKI
jgi:hypothetical protein